MGTTTASQPRAQVIAILSKLGADRTRWPAMVTCQHGGFPGLCAGHADCRAAFWAGVDAEAAQAAERATSRARLLGLQPRVTRLDGTLRRPR